MRKSLLNFKRISNLILALLIGLLLFVTCKKDKVKEADKIIEPVKSYSLQETINNSSYFNADSIKKFNLADGIFNNLGIGKNKNTGNEESSIFRVNVSLQPLVSYSINEFFTKKIIVTWDYKNNQFLTDSIISRSLKLDSSYSVNLSNIPNTEVTKLDSSLCISLVLIKRFGLAQLDLSNPALNNFLSYKTSLVGGVRADSIPFNPEFFQGLFGDEFTSSIILGTAMIANLRIIKIDVNNDNKNKVLSEAIELLTQLIKGNSNWNDLIVKSNYFKHSIFYIVRVSATPGIDFSFGIDNLTREMNNLESLYQKADFGILAKGYQPYSKLYPKYNFIQSK